MERSALKKYWIWGLLVPALSCDLQLKDDDRGEAVARVYDQYLYADDILEVMDRNLAGEDSVVWARNYINNWAKEQLIITKAEFNLSDQEKDFEELVEQYRYDLLKFTYQQRYVDEHIDTTIAPEEIAVYYEEHKSDFELKENIVKVHYVVLSGEAPDINDAREWFSEPEDKDSRGKLMEYSTRYAKRFNLLDTNWVRFNDLAKFIPLQTYNQQEFLSNHKHLEMEHEGDIYLIRFLTYKIAEDVSPLPYVEKTIKNIILNKRKQEIIMSMEERLVNDAYEKKDFEVY